MTARASDRLLGLVLVALSSLWCWGVIISIPGIEDGSRLGARGFPLGLGVLLGLLGLLVFVRTLTPASQGAGVRPARETPPRTEIWAVGTTVALLFFYAVLLEYTGFVIATAVITALAVGPVLGVWRPRLIAGMSLGMALGIYLIFGKFLGVYLPYGKIVNLAF
jgi:putative tricarboxylic transport membrane protein